jgi:hypothetical protein
MLERMLRLNHWHLLQIKICSKAGYESENTPPVIITLFPLSVVRSGEIVVSIGPLYLYGSIGIFADFGTVGWV